MPGAMAGCGTAQCVFNAGLIMISPYFSPGEIVYCPNLSDADAWLWFGSVRNVARPRRSSGVSGRRGVVARCIYLFAVIRVKCPAVLAFLL